MAFIIIHLLLLLLLPVLFIKSFILLLTMPYCFSGGMERVTTSVVLLY